MKMKKWILGIAVVCLAGAAGMLLYQKNLCSSPEEVTRLQLDAIFKENKTVNENDGVDLSESFMNRLQETQLACAMAEPEEHQQEFFESIMDGLKKTDYEVAEVSRSEEKAEVSVSIDYFKLPEIVQDAQKALQEDQESSSEVSAEEMVKKTYGAIADEFQKGPSDGSKNVVTVTLHREGHKWKTDDKFEDEIFNTILQPY